MSIRAKRTVVSTGTVASTVTGWIPLNLEANPFCVSLGYVKGASGAIAQVQHTFDDVSDTSITPTVFAHDDLTAMTTDDEGNYAFPVSAVRLAITSGSGTSTLHVLQTGL